MSMLIQAVEASQEVLRAEGGLLDFIDVKTVAVQNTARGVGSMLALVFFIYQVIASRAQMARMVVAALAAGLFVWIVFNVTTIEEHFDSEFNSAPIQAEEL